MADVTYYVALPFLQDETGSPVAGAAEECQSSSAALRRAELLSKTAGCVGAVAFSRTRSTTPTTQRPPESGAARQHSAAARAQ